MIFYSAYLKQLERESINMIDVDGQLNSYVLGYLKSKHVSLHELAETVAKLQGDYVDNLEIEDCELAINQVLKKREILFPIATGINLDKLAKANKLDEPLQSAIKNDYGLYGVDETLAMSMTHPYGTIAITNFGYLDKAKHTTALKLDEDQRKHKGKVVNTFVDDIISAIIADASALIAHNESDFTEDK